MEMRRKESKQEEAQAREMVLTSHHMHKCIRVGVCVRVCERDHSIPLNLLSCLHCSLFKDY